MKKIVLIFLTLSSLMFGEIYPGKLEVVGDRTFQYYCVDGILFLDSKSKSSSYNNMFGQVYKPYYTGNLQSIGASIPYLCEVKNNQFLLK